MSQPIRILLADDHAVVRRGIREILEEEEDLEVVGEARDGEQALLLLRDRVPDVALLDVRMPGRTGIEVIQAARAEGLPTRFLLLSAYDDDPYVIAALRAGAHGYVLKSAPPESIVTAVRTVARGQKVLDPQLAQKVLRHVLGEAEEPALTERELEVLQGVARGWTNRRIGHHLGISERTVQGHLARIYEKLEVSTRTEAVLKAIQLGLLTLPEEEDDGTP